jgi:glucose/arabinose dehydrogenase
MLIRAATVTAMTLSILSATWGAEASAERQSLGQGAGMKSRPALSRPDSAGEPAEAGGLSIGTVRVAQGLARPVFATFAPGDPDRLFIVEQRSGSTGRIRILNLQTGALQSVGQHFLSVPGVSTASEQGLLGLAFHPNYQQNGYFYIHFTNSAGASVIRRYTVSANPDFADSGSDLTILTVSQPFSNHNAGWLDFGPDGYLYIAMGDGGSGGDPGDRAQNLSVLLGKMLRIDVDAGAPYAIPPSNPFVGQPGLDEIWTYGLRNPWRNSFDRLTGDMYIADVGQNLWEEINFEPAGSAGGINYGWRCYEGNKAHNLTGCPPPSTMQFPFHVYSISGTPHCSVIGGYVYRGGDIPDLQGIYFWADYCSARIWSATVIDGEIVGPITDRTAELAPPAGLLTWISSFGEDYHGEMYVCALSSGEVFRIINTGPPAHNICENALAVNDGVTPFSNENATTTGPDEPDHCDFFGDTTIQNDIWFHYTATCSGELTVATCGSGFAAKLGVYADCPTGPGEIIACDLLSCPGENRALVTIPATAGQTFKIRVGGHGGAVGTGQLTIECAAVSCPEDLNGDGSVDVLDLLQLLDAWGACPGCSEDLNGDGVVDVLDLLQLLDAWGEC